MSSAINQVFLIHKRRCFYFSLIMIVGGIGCWITAAQHLTSVTASSGYSFCGNLGTFAISLAVMSFTDHLVLTQNEFKLTKALTLLFSAAIAVIAGVVSLVLWNGYGVFGSWLSFALAGLVWWLVHLENEALDEPNAFSTLGGENP